MAEGKISVQEAKASQLAEFATRQFGIDPIPHQKGKEFILEVLRAAGFSGDEIDTYEAAGTDLENIKPPDPMPVAPPKPAAHLAGRSGKWCVIMIHRDAGDKKSRPVPMALNGRQLWVERNKRSIIPLEFEEILRHATRNEPIVDEDDKIIGWDSIPQYSYSFYGLCEPPPDGKPCLAGPDTRILMDQGF